jgi:hypothetical protein
MAPQRSTCRIPLCGAAAQGPLTLPQLPHNWAGLAWSTNARAVAIQRQLTRNDGESYVMFTSSRANSKAKSRCVGQGRHGARSQEF